MYQQRKLSVIQANLAKQAKLFPGLTLAEIQEITDKEDSLVTVKKEIENRPKEKCITSFEKLLN